MGYPLRWYLPDVIYDVTTRTVQERYLLRPGEIERALILGVIGRALALYQSVRLHAFVYLSNHMHMLLSALQPEQIAPFIGFVNGKVATRIGKRQGWGGHFWSSRARVIPVVDDESAEGRLRYILSHGVKEGLVERPEDWPGASSTPALLGEELRGEWATSKRTRNVDGARASHEGEGEGEGDDDTSYPVTISPLPSWRHLAPAERVARVRELCQSIVVEHSERRNAPVLGTAKVLAMDPMARPEAPARRRAPVCHASTPERRMTFLVAREVFTHLYRAAARANEGEHIPYRGGFPPGSYGGRRKFVSSTTCVAPWLEGYIPTTWSESVAVPAATTDGVGGVGGVGGLGVSGAGGYGAHRYRPNGTAVMTTQAARPEGPAQPLLPEAPARPPQSSADEVVGARSPPRRRKPPKRDRAQVSSE